MKKKIISALLCVAMVATVAVGCGKSSDSKSTANLQILLPAVIAVHW